MYGERELAIIRNFGQTAGVQYRSVCVLEAFLK